jgi:CheY-like chemotaxis protein
MGLSPLNCFRAEAFPLRSAHAVLDQTDAADSLSKSAKTATNSLRVLVVDDEKLVADTLSEILNHFNYDASAFYSGETAIEAARLKCPDFVLSDVVMPTLNGVETVLRIREICPNARVILLSGNAATADLLRHARDQGHDFELLAKPIHPDEILKRLH